MIPMASARAYISFLPQHPVSGASDVTAGSFYDRLMRTGMGCRRNDGLARRQWDFLQSPAFNLRPVLLSDYLRKTAVERRF